jgi:hypothetical protein
VNAARRNGFYREGDKRLLAYVERAGEGARNDPAHACSGKFRHATWRAAAAEAQRMTLKGEGQCRAYRCPFCDRWHVGHARPAAARAERAESVTPVVAPPPSPTPPASPLPPSWPLEPPDPPASARAGRPTRSREENRRRYAAVARFLARGLSLREACERVGVNRGQLQRAWAQERARQASGTGATAEAVAGRTGTAAGPPRPSAPQPAPPPARQVFVRLYDRWRRHEPAWAAVPGPRLANARPVLRLEHLALLTDAERRALFPAPTTRSAQSAGDGNGADRRPPPGGATAGTTRTFPGREQGARRPW